MKNLLKKIIKLLQALIKKFFCKNGKINVENVNKINNSLKKSFKEFYNE